MTGQNEKNTFHVSRKLMKIEDLYHRLLKPIHQYIPKEAINKTPIRARKSWEYITGGYDMDLKDIINDAIFEIDDDGMVFAKDIEFYSLCEHHLLPFFGKISIGYIPDKKILGLSKIPRIIDMFSRRLQVQERMTHDVAKAISVATDAKGVGVIAQGQHLCSMMRGVRKQNMYVVTSSMLGIFQEDKSIKHEFLSLL